MGSLRSGTLIGRAVVEAGRCGLRGWDAVRCGEAAVVSLGCAVARVEGGREDCERNEGERL